MSGETKLKVILRSSMNLLFRGCADVSKIRVRLSLTPTNEPCYTSLMRKRNKYAFAHGERKENPMCICPLENKSGCFKEFVIVPEHTDRYNRVYKETSYWKIICQHLNEISRQASEGAA